MEAWINLDLQIFPSVDVVADVTSGLPFRSSSMSSVFAEHFLEHLALDEAIGFLEEAHRVLEPGGWVRLSTPNLEWVLATHYRPRQGSDDEPRGILDLNRAFYGWEHRFLWDRDFLEQTLTACGFADLRWPAYGESSHPRLRSLEIHDRSADSREVPHLLIVEARQGPEQPRRLQALRNLVEERFLGHMEEARLRRARFEIERLNGEIGRLHAEIGRLHGELEHAGFLLGRSWSERAQLEARNADLRARLEEARSTISWMEASRFWKLRNAWFSLKAALRLVPRGS